MKLNQITSIITALLITPLEASMENIKDSTSKPFPGIVMRSGFTVTPLDEQRVMRRMLVNEMQSAFYRLPEHIAKAVKRDGVVAPGILHVLPKSVQLALLGDENQGHILIQPQLINSIGFEVKESGVLRAQHLTSLGIKIYQAPLADPSLQNVAFKKQMVVDTFLAAAQSLEGVSHEVDVWDPAHRLDYFHSLGVLHYWAACNSNEKNELIHKSQTYLGKAVNVIAQNQQQESMRQQMLHVLRAAKLVHIYKSRL